MNPEIKKQWVEALRSGRYKQGREALRTTDNRYCCLGVLADMCGQTWQHNTDRNEYGYVDKDGKLQFGILDDNLLDKLDMTYGEQEILWEKNDDGETFPEIATYIERNM